MLRRVFFLLGLLLCLIPTFSAYSQPRTEAPRQPRILLLLDGSSSMLQPWAAPEIRFKAAARVIEGLMDSIYAVNPNVEFGLRVYGHQSPAQNNDCFDSRMEVMFSKNNLTQMGLRLASLRPFGVSPIAYSLRQAAEYDLVDDVRNAYSIILITDGGESCGGNICDVVKTLIERKIYFKPYIISLVEYAPLKEQYACLGRYLQVAKPGDIGPAINQIVEAYRPILSMPIIGASLPEGQSAQKPPPVVIVTPPVIEVPPRVAETTALLIVGRMRPLTLRRAPRTQPQRLALPEPAAIEAPPRVAETTAVLLAGRLRVVKLRRSPLPAPQRMSVPKPPVVVYIPEPRKPDTIREPQPPLVTPPREADRMVALQARNARSLEVPVRRYFPIAPARLIVPRPPAIPREPEPRVADVPTPKPPQPKVDTPKRPSVTIRDLKPEPVKPAGSTAPKPVQPAPAAPEVVAEDAAETQLSIYFTDGRGKFYSSTPQLRLVDAATGKQVKQFYRTVDPNGNPDPQVVSAGTYNIVVATRANLVLKKIVVKEKKNNKVIVRVNNGSLRFRYDNNPNRPVTEFEATVNIRFEDGPTNQKQRCVDELEYPPGNYHVEINTLPRMQQNVDIDFGAMSEIGIPEPGFVQFTNTNAIGPVQLFSPLGNKFMRFYGMRVNGVQESQRVRLLPGVYEVHWIVRPNTPAAKEQVMRFNVQSNKETQIELN